MGRDFLNMTVALTFRKQWAIMLRPVLRQGICLFVGTPAETKNYILLSTRGRRSCYSRPQVAFTAGPRRETRGRGQFTFRGPWGSVEILAFSRLFFKKMLTCLKHFYKMFA